jgi:nucleotide-binding universal stress UspA family protein
MTKTVVVPLDGSLSSERALRPAVELSASFRSGLVLFACAGEDRDEMACYLAGQARRIKGLPVTTVIHEGYESVALAEQVHALPDATVCMAPDLAAPAESVLGPVAEDTIEGGDVPVVLVGPSYAPCGHVREGRRGLVMCVDGSAAASSIEPLVADWALALDLEVQLVTAYRPHHDDEQGPSVPIERMQREQDHLAFRLRRQGVPVTTEHLDGSRNPAFAITAYAAGHRAMLIAACARGFRHDLFEVVGKTVLHIVRLSPVPVVVVVPSCPSLHA